MMKNLAQINLGPEGGFRGKGPLGLENVTSENTGTTSIFRLSNAIQTTIGVITIIAFIWFTIQFFLGAVSVVTAGGDKAKVESARNKITTGAIGLVVVITGVFAIQVIGQILGVEILDLRNSFLRLFII